MTRVSRLAPLGRSILALTIAALGAGAVAQDAGEPAPRGTISIPENVTIFGKNDPNNRRATAIVNGDIITGTEVDERVALVVAANQGKIQPEEMERLRLQILRNLIDETLQIQEAKAQELEVKNAEVDQSFARLSQQNFPQNPKAMEGYLKRIGSSVDSLKRQIRGELAWNMLLRRNVHPFVNVSEEEVKEAMERLKAAKGTEEYHIGEIFLAATPETQAPVYENAKKIVEQIKQGASFSAMARTYSEASTKSVGGDLGWIRLAQLPTELAGAAQGLQPGQLVGPVQIPGGFSILVLIDKRAVLTADPRDAMLSLKQISIDFPAGTSEADATKRAADFATAIKGAKGCGNVGEVAKTIGAQVVENDQVKARDLPGPLQESLLKLSLGETTPPFGSIQEGVRMLMLCGRDDPQVDSGPKFEDMMSQMEDDRVNKRAQAYMRDLRRDAVIEYN
ncbi:peptidylprolyl isomerase [Novosphingobium sp. TH158]|nr:peptidylprolyl isomerase [Novosphingobium sp. TH158]PLK27782.1 peptidylprolyl isomerase [Novosphingobium sp. TH158]